MYSVPPIVCPGTIRPRDPASFSGLDDRDVEDWLSTFERISTHNKWDDAMKLNNVGFSFTHLAELWFNNHRREMSTWAEFKERFMKAFGRPEVRKLQAEQRLRVRAQKTGEDFTSYTEDVVDLCKRVDPSMLETEKVKHILKGVDDDAFQMLLSKDPRTVSDVIRLCQSYDELRKQRAFTRRPLAQNEPLASLAVDLDDPSVLGSLQSCATTERPLADSEVPSTESRSCGRSNSHDRRRGDRGRSASRGQSRVPGCSREASDSRGNQAPPNFRPQSTNLKTRMEETEITETYAASTPASHPQRIVPAML
ncbi:uncharacterized protein LOC144163741 [Haemaphysalis longicornis]